MRKEIRPQNIRVTSDMFIVQVFRQTGLIGLAFFLGLFIVIPLYFIFVKRFTTKIRVIAAPILVVGLASGHYDPFVTPQVSIVVWYLFSCLSRELTNMKKVVAI